MVAHGRRRSVDPDLAPRLGVLQLGDAHVGQFGFARIEDADPHQVVFAAVSYTHLTLPTKRIV